jgi:hypothetical protein
MEFEIIEETIDQVKDILKSVDWQKFHELCTSLGSELNDRQWRFMKAIFLENAVADYSNDMIQYVGDTEIGCDLTIPSLSNTKIEMKYVEGCLFSGKKLLLRSITKEIKLLNSQGTNTHTNLPDHYSDYLLIVDMYGAALISKEKLKEYVTSHGDSLTAKIPTDQLHIIFKPEDILVMTERKNLHIKQTMMSAIKQIIQSNK